MTKRNYVKWTDEMKQFVLDNYRDLYTKELTDRLNKKFGLNLSCTTVASHKKRHKLRSGLPSRFEKGHIPASKGKKMSAEKYAKLAPTMFKKRQRPTNTVPIGSEVKTVDGYVEIKIQDPNTWKLKHRHVWEQAKGPIPDGHVLIFLDEDKTNCELSNLKLLSRSELLTMNRYHLFQESAELNEVAANLARVINTASEEKRKRGER